MPAAFNNLAEQEELTRRYRGLCEHYAMRASRNNPGESHENGSIESSHGHLKNAVRDALLMRGTKDFDDLGSYRTFIDEIVSRKNRRNGTRIDTERASLQHLPGRRCGQIAAPADHAQDAEERHHRANAQPHCQPQHGHDCDLAHGLVCGLIDDEDFVVRRKGVSQGEADFSAAGNDHAHLSDCSRPRRFPL